MRFLSQKFVIQILIVILALMLPHMFINNQLMYDNADIVGHAVA
jgi:hypothetical protein